MPRFETILLTGINGQVGHALQSKLATLGNVIGLDRSQLDLTDISAIRRCIQQIKPDLIVNPAAYTAVDKAESEPELAMAINGIAPGIIGEEAKKLGALLIHFSTDYVFDGAKATPYVETDITNPLSVYGKTKLAGEEAIRAADTPHMIFRTSWVYGAYGKNFLRTILRLAQERDQLRIVGDQFGAPTSSVSIANATVAALLNWEKGQSGTYHLSNSGLTSWHGFAQTIIKQYSDQTETKGWPALRTTIGDVTAIDTSDYPTPAHRPKNSRLDCNKLQTKLKVTLPDWEDALSDVMRSTELNPS
ncbi:MAG: dTDP-4-dehydrorhamnose reductase [Methylophilaceae bacterium]